MPNWWKCQIAGDTALIPFVRGSVVYAKNGEEFITLFDGMIEVKVPKRAQKHIKLLSRLGVDESAAIQKGTRLEKESPNAWDERDLHR